MHQFKDSQQRQWKISLNGWQLKKLKERLNFDARDHEAIVNAANDPALLCDVLFVLCEDQAKAASITDQQFGEALGGDVIEQAAECYLQESIDFFPQRQRPALRAMLAKVTDTQNRATALAEEKMASPAMDQMIERAMTEASQKMDALLAGTSIGNSSGKSPESLA